MSDSTRDELAKTVAEQRCGAPCPHGGFCSLTNDGHEMHESRSPSGAVACRWSRVTALTPATEKEKDL